MADRPRKIDRHRRQRVIEGALAAIAEHGVEGLTHRRVAEAADVSLSATTYYFATLEELLEAAMREAAARDVAELRRRFAEAPAADDVPAVLAGYIRHAASEGRQEAIVVLELYLAALRREALREVAQAWDDAWDDVLTPLLGEVATAAVVAAIGGLIHRALLHDDRDQAAIADVLRGLVKAPAAAP